jgi:site-specific DNA-methyltransferase (cytosine-N4-specific)
MFVDYSDSYWDFKNVKTSGINKIAKYPAVMVAPMQGEILSSLVRNNPNYSTMLDPFHGSGVSLVEGEMVGLRVFGIDINPYAHLIAKVKLSTINDEIACARNFKISNKLQSMAEAEYKNHNFTNISKWFRDDVIEDLSKIRHLIYEESDANIRNYYWLCLGETARIHSNTRTSTFKLHAKEQQKIKSMENNTCKHFIERITFYYKFLSKNSHAVLFCDDSIEKMKSFDEYSFDIICTSPPYGDNNTTVTYGQFSSLQLNWIDIEDIGCSRSWLDNFSKIDSASIGGAYSYHKLKGRYLSLTNFLNKIHTEKHQKILRFMAGYEAAFFEMTRVLRPGGSMVLTLANRRVDNTEFPLVDITKELAAYHDLHLSGVINRKIQNKRMPYKVSHVNNYGAVFSMSKETVLMFSKKQVHQSRNLITS